MGLFGSSVEVATDGEIFAKLRELVARSKGELHLIAPYIDFNEDFVRVLEQRAKGGDSVRVTFRRDKAGEYAAAEWFAKLVAVGVEFRSVEHLHAKIYRSQERLIVTSMNLTEASWNASREIALIVTAKDSVYAEVDAYAKRIAADSEPVVARAAAQAAQAKTSGRAKKLTTDGYCLRCATEIPLNPKRPYCKEDYEKWAQYENVTFKDSYCHGCGDETEATMARPLCLECYRAMK